MPHDGSSRTPISAILYQRPRRSRAMYPPNLLLLSLPPPPSSYLYPLAPSFSSLFRSSFLALYNHMHYARRCIRAAYSRVQIPREHVAGRAGVSRSESGTLVVLPSLSMPRCRLPALSLFRDTRSGLNKRQATEIKSGPHDSIMIPISCCRFFFALPLPLSTPFLSSSHKRDATEIEIPSKPF